MRGSLIILIISITFSYGFIKSEDTDQMKNGNFKLDYLQLSKITDKGNVLNDQWHGRKKTKRIISKRQAPPEWILHQAAKEGNWNITAMYIPLVHDIDTPGVGGWSPMMWAAHNNHLDVVILLLDNGANVNHINYRNESALHWATYYQHIDVVVELVNRGINVDQQEEKGITALMSAAILGSVELVNILLGGGADKYIKDDIGRNAMIYATKSANTEVVDILGDFEYINEFDQWGLTAIHHGVLLRDMDPLEEGLTQCPDLTLEDANGNTAEEVALVVGNMEAYEIIQRHKRELANGCFLDYDMYKAISKEFFDCREFQCHCYGNWTATGKDDPSCAPKTVNVYSIQEMIAPWLANIFSMTTQSPEN